MRITPPLTRAAKRTNSKNNARRNDQQHVSTNKRQKVRLKNKDRQTLLIDQLHAEDIQKRTKYIQHTIPEPQRAQTHSQPCACGLNTCVANEQIA